MFNGRRIPLEQARDSPESKKWLNTLVLWWCWFDMCRAYVFVPFQSTPVLIQLQIQNIAMLQRDRNLSIIPSTLQPPIHLSIQSWYLPISCRASWCDCEFNRTGKWKMETTWMKINGGIKVNLVGGIQRKEQWHDSTDSIWVVHSWWHVVNVLLSQNSYSEATNKHMFNYIGKIMCLMIMRIKEVWFCRRCSQIYY